VFPESVIFFCKRFAIVCTCHLLTFVLTLGLSLHSYYIHWCTLTFVKSDERSQSHAEDSEVKDELKVKDVNKVEGQIVSGADLMQIRVENIKNNQEKGAPV